MTGSTPAVTAKRPVPRFAKRVSADPRPAETLDRGTFLRSERKAYEHSCTRILLAEAAMYACILESRMAFWI